MDDAGICPHCEKAGIFIGARTYYSRGWPARCRECGGLSFDRSRDEFGCLYELILWTIVVGLLALGSAIAVQVIVVLAISFLIYYWWRSRTRPKPITPFRPISAEASRRSRILTYVSLMCSVALVAVLLAVLHYFQ
jgi:uncharacterized membrane protein